MKLKIPEEAIQKKRQAERLRERANELDREAMDLVIERTRKFMREVDDKLLNRTQCLEYLPISSFRQLKWWEKKYRPYGYLQFEDNKLLRSELLEFVDAKKLRQTQWHIMAESKIDLLRQNPTKPTQSCQSCNCIVLNREYL